MSCEKVPDSDPSELGGSNGNSNNKEAIAGQRASEETKIIAQVRSGPVDDDDAQQVKRVVTDENAEPGQKKVYKSKIKRGFDEKPKLSSPPESEDSKDGCAPEGEGVGTRRDESEKLSRRPRLKGNNCIPSEPEKKESESKMEGKDEDNNSSSMQELPYGTKVGSRSRSRSSGSGSGSGSSRSSSSSSSSEGSRSSRSSKKRSSSRSRSSSSGSHSSGEEMTNKVEKPDGTRRSRSSSGEPGEIKDSPPTSPICSSLEGPKPDTSEKELANGNEEKNFQNSNVVDAKGLQSEKDSNFGVDLTDADGQKKESTTRPPINLRNRKISLSFSKDAKANQTGSDASVPVRKRKWGSTKTLQKTAVISTDSLKDLIPDVKPLSLITGGDGMTLDLVEGQESELEDSVPVAAIVKDLKIRRTVTQLITIDEGNVAEPAVKEVFAAKPAYLQPLSLLDEPLGRPRSPSPARNPPSSIVHIRNLVRPFTLNQLKELLARTGSIVQDGFWIDKIKSKCYATYETQQQAVETRQALHGVQWPPSNRKNLIVDYADEDELQFHMKMDDVSTQKPSNFQAGPAPAPALPLMVKEREPMKAIPRNCAQRETLPSRPIREWDRDKIGERSPGERERERRKRVRTPSPASRDLQRNSARTSRDHREKRDKKERRKADEEAPAKLLDDLFRKTKVTPCIYWLPLTTEQIKVKEEQRKQRDVEREKRRQLVKKEETKMEATTYSKNLKKSNKNETANRNRRKSSSPSRNKNRKR